jgi:hypothetical protein
MSKDLDHTRLLKIPMVVVMVAVAVAGLLDMTMPSERSTAALLLAAFAVILFTPFMWKGKEIWVHVGLAILSALAAGLLSLHRGWSFFPILFFLLAPTAMMSLPIKAGVVWIGIFTIITGIVLYLVNGLIGLALLLPYFAGYVFFGIFGWVTLRAEKNRLHTEQLLTELQVAHQQLQEYADRME